MRLASGDWSDRLTSPAGQLREQRSGMSGFGARPALHPAWRAPSEADGEGPDGRSEAGRVAASDSR